METKTIGNVKVTAIFGGTVFAAWEPSSVMGPHGTIMTIDGAWYGTVASRRDPAVELMPVGPARERAARESQAARYPVWPSWPSKQGSPT